MIKKYKNIFNLLVLLSLTIVSLLSSTELNINQNLTQLSVERLESESLEATDIYENLLVPHTYFQSLNSFKNLKYSYSIYYLQTSTRAFKKINLSHAISERGPPTV